MNDNYKNIFIQSYCLTTDELTDYISGSLTANKVRKVELHLADCQMCNDELEGLQALNNNEKLSIITTSLNNKIDLYFNKKDIFTPTIKENKKTFKLKKNFTIAASIALLVTAGYFIYDLKNNTLSQNLAETNIPKENTVEEENIIIETVKPEKQKQEIDNKENLTSNIKKTKNNTSIKENSTSIDKVESTLFEEENVNEVNLYKETSEITEEEVTETIIDDATNSNDLKSEKKAIESSNNSKISFGSTRGTGILTNKKTNKSYKSLKDSGLLSFNIKSYNDAISAFKKYLQHNPNDFEVIFKIGMSYYNIKNYDKAIFEFNKITSSKNNKYFEDAQWYKANVLLNQNKNTEALAILNNIIENAGKFSQKAKIKISKISN